MKEKDEIILFFQIVLGKKTKAASNWINSFPKNRTTTNFLLSVSFFYSLTWHGGHRIVAESVAAAVGEGVRPRYRTVLGHGRHSEQRLQRLVHWDAAHRVTNSMRVTRVAVNFSTIGKQSVIFFFWRGTCEEEKKLFALCENTVGTPLCYVIKYSIQNLEI